MSVKITDKVIKSLTPPEHGNRITYDSVLPGFGVRITAAGVISFILNYHIHGRERRFTIGQYEVWTLLAARNKALELRKKVSEGIDPLADRQEQRKAPTVADLCDRFLDEYASAHKRPHSIRDDRQMITSTIQPKLGTLQVSAVGREDIEKLHTAMKGTPYLANRVIALLSKMFNLAVGWKLRGDNPAKGIPRFHEDKKECWLQSEELNRLIEALDAYPDQTKADALRLLLLTGSRSGEVLTAQWPMFDLQQGVWTKPSSHTKEKKIEHIPLNAEALELLARMKDQSTGEGFLFPGKSDHLTTLRKPWAEVCKAAGLSGVRIHDLRHTFASNLVSAGVSLHTVGKLLGHTQAQTTARYAHVAHETMRTASGIMGEIFKKAGDKGKK
jgi:integrase